MKTGKDLTTRFQEAEQKLSVQPSPKAWRKLETRLEAQRRRQGRVLVMRWQTLTALAAVLVLVFGIFLWNLGAKRENLARQGTPPPLRMEELQNDGDCNPYCLLLKSRSELPAYYVSASRKPS